MIQIIANLIELIVNLIDLFKPKNRSNEQKVEYKNFIINIENTYSTSTASTNSLFWFKIALIFIFLLINIGFYNYISIVLFSLSILFTLLKFYRTSKYHLPGKISQFLAFRNSLYSLIALTSFSMPSFVMNLYEQFPSHDKILTGFSFLYSWITDCAKVLLSQLNGNNPTAFFALLYICVRVIGLALICKDIICFISNKQFKKQIYFMEKYPKSERNSLIFLAVFCFIIFNITTLYSKILQPLLNVVNTYMNN